MTSRTSLAAFALLAIMPLAACSPTIARPHLQHPGPANLQRYNASQFDPYPQTDMGPEIVGGRPIDYMVPVPEVERANQYRESQRTPTVPMITPAQPVYGPAPLGSLPVTPAIPATPVYTQPTTQPPVEYRY